jgi:hypothetical protein
VVTPTSAAFKLLLGGWALPRQVCLFTGNATGCIPTVALPVAEPLAYACTAGGSSVLRTTPLKLANRRVQLGGTLSGLPLPAPPTLWSAVSWGGFRLHPDRGAQSGVARRPKPEYTDSPAPPNRRSQACACRVSSTADGHISPPGEKTCKNLTLALIKGPQRTYRGSEAMGRFWNQHNSLALNLGRETAEA